MVTRETIAACIASFSDKQTREDLTETVKRFDDRIDELIEKANSHVVECELIPFFNEYYLLIDLIGIQWRTDMNTLNRSLDSFKRDVGYKD